MHVCIYIHGKRHTSIYMYMHACTQVCACIDKIAYICNFLDCFVHSLILIFLRAILNLVQAKQFWQVVFPRDRAAAFGAEDVNDVQQAGSGLLSMGRLPLRGYNVVPVFVV